MKNKQVFSFIISLFLLFPFIIVQAQSSASDTFKDIRDGNVYSTILIGDQLWMAENLKYLPDVIDPDTGSVTEVCYYVYGYQGTDVTEAMKTSIYKTYGVLYNWPAAMNNADKSMDIQGRVQGVCPEGWHLPAVSEWNDLIEYLGGDGDAGCMLKESGSMHWLSPNPNATNETGFTALPGGGRFRDRNFDVIGYYGIWWMATEVSANEALRQLMYYDLCYLYRSSKNKANGFSVRCIKDSRP